MKGTRMVSPSQPYTTEGMPTKISMAGWKMRVPASGAISVMKIAAASENGTAIRRARPQVTREPKMYTAAPTVPPPWPAISVGFQSEEKRNSPMEWWKVVKVTFPLMKRKTPIVTVRAIRKRPHMVTTTIPPLPLLFFFIVCLFSYILRALH